MMGIRQLLSTNRFQLFCNNSFAKAFAFRSIDYGIKKHKKNNTASMLVFELD
jgi:hypothetical protein